MNVNIASDLYNRLLSVNEEAFDAGLFDAAYYALAAAIHCAEYMEADDSLQNISQIAMQQLNWIDQHHPEYEHSTKSSLRRSHNKSIFALLSSQANTLVRMRKAKLQGDKVKKINRGE